MNIFRREIEKAINAELYYLALMMALALPDICAALQSSDGKSNGHRYKTWWERWMLPSYPSVGSDVAWNLRCGVFHQARASHPQMPYSRILFTLPNPQQITIHRAVVDEALNLDLVTFCMDVVEAVDRWYKEKQDEPSVVRHLPLLVQYRPNGLSPYISGLPLIS